MKRVISFGLVLAMLLTMLPIHVLADEVEGDAVEAEAVSEAAEISADLRQEEEPPEEQEAPAELTGLEASEALNAQKSSNPEKLGIEEMAEILSDEAEQVEETSKTYPWDGLTDEEFVCWVYAEENQEYLKPLATEENAEIYEALLQRVEEIEDDALYAEVIECYGGKFIETTSAAVLAVGTVSYGAYNGIDYTQQTSDPQRIAALDKAKRMVTIQWTAPCDFPTWTSSGGLSNKTMDINGSTSYSFLQGHTYQGIPYSMKGRTYDDRAWSDYVVGGNMTKSDMSARYYANTSFPMSTAKGIDCSYFVCTALNAGAGTNINENTAAMLDNGNFSLVSGSSKAERRNNMIPGDIFLKSGHVMLYVGKTSGGNYAVFESCTTYSKCQYTTYSAVSLSDYDCYRFNKFGSGGNPPSSQKVGIWHTLVGLQHSEGTYGTYGEKDSIRLGTKEFNVQVGNKYTMGQSYEMTAINGVRLDHISSPSYSSNWEAYSVGTEFTMKDECISFQYVYFPNEYTITYNLDGGTNASSNPDKYTVYYGVTLANPTKTGWKFAGWKDQNGNIITGINQGKDMSAFVGKEDCYEAIKSELATRRTGNISLTATWIEDRHNFSYAVTKRPTPSEKGIFTASCSVCNLSVDIPVLPVLNKSNYDYSIVKEPTCTANGTERYTCRKTSFGVYSWETIYFDEVIPATNHSYSYKVTKDPTTYAAGTLTGTCSKCKGTKSITLPKLDSTNYTYTVIQEATCTETGVGRYTWNTTTYDNYSFDVEIGKKHEYDFEILYPPTESQEGCVLGICSVCENYFVDYDMPKLNTTDYTCNVIVTPSCTTAGNIHYEWKDTTHGTFSWDVKEKLPHVYSSSDVTKEPTSYETGILVGVCENCSGEKTVTLPRLGTINYTCSIEKEPTAKEEGLAKYTWNTTTYGVIVFDVVLPKLKDESIIDSGAAGAGVEWALDRNGVLTISGSGAMEDYGTTGDYGEYFYYEAPAPWQKYNADITAVAVERGVTSLGIGAFFHLPSLTQVSLRGSISAIPDAAFSDCTALAAIEIPDSVTEIGENAFYRCSGLTRIAIPNSVTSIGNGVFSGCTSLTSVTIPDSVTNIGNHAFLECVKLKELIIPKNVSTIGNYAFDFCTGLSTITIPENVVEIGEGAFWGCRLTEFRVAPGNTAFAAVNGVLFDYNKTTLLAYPQRRTANSYTVPDGVVTIGYGAFNNANNLNSVTLSEGVTQIDDTAFQWCEYLTSIVIPRSVKSIGDIVFEWCKNLRDVYYGGTEADWGKIDIIAEGNGSLLNANIHFKESDILISGKCGNNLTWKLDTSGNLTISGIGAMENYAWNNPQPWNSCLNSIQYVTIENGVTSIGKNAFNGCANLTSIVIPDSVTSFGDHAFWQCNALSDIAIPNGIASLDDEVFYGCTSLTSFSIPTSVTSIGSEAFAYCSRLSNIIIPDSIVSIGNDAFKNCDRLKSITIPSSVSSIGEQALGYYYYNGLKKVSDFTICGVLGSEAERYATENEFVFKSVISGICGEDLNWTLIDGTLTISGTGAMDNYSQTEKAPWNSYSTNIQSVVINPGVSWIGDYAFYKCGSLTSVTIPNSVTRIGDFVFDGCTSLNGITIPNSVTKIGDVAFNGCTSLTGIVIPDSVTVIGNSVFSGCSSLTDITIPNSVTSIGDDAFFGCTALSSITIPDSVSSIGEFAFYHCDNVTSVIIPGSVVSIGSQAFGYCTGLTSIIIEDGLLSIADEVFYGCVSLTNVSIPASVTSIGSLSFAYCYELTDITIPDSVTSIGNDAFRNCDSLKRITIPSSVTSIGDQALGYYYDNGLKKVSDFTIHGYPGTAAETYATENGFTFVPLGAAAVSVEVTIPGGAAFGASVSAPEGGWKEGTNTFTVACDKPCVVAVSYDGGATYIRLTASDANGGKSFAVENLTADAEILVQLSGDTNGDGVLTNADSVSGKAVFLGKKDANARQQLALDVNHDGNITNADIVKLKAAFLGKTTLNW